MKINDLTLKDLQYVIAIDHFKSFSKAADACMISQSALSKQIRYIENGMGVELFERSRQILTTAIGQRFVEQAKRILDEAGRLLEIVKENSEPLTGPFYLGVIASSCPYLLPLIIGLIHKEFPTLKLIIKEGLTEDLVEELNEGHLDAVIAATTFEDDNLEYLPMFFEPFYLACHKKHPLAKAQTIGINNINPDELLLLADGHCLKGQTMTLCAIPRERQFFGVEATSIETLLQMTAGELGVAVIPRLAVKGSHQRLKQYLSFIPFKDNKIGRVMAIYFRKQYPLKADIETLTSRIQFFLPKDLDLCIQVEDKDVILNRNSKPILKKAINDRVKKSRMWWLDYD